VEKMKSGEVLSGFYFNAGRTEFFVKTEQKNVTVNFIRKILSAINEDPNNEKAVKYIKYHLMKANCQIKSFVPSKEVCKTYGYKENERIYYYSIFGKDFGGYGSDNIDDGRTIVIEV
jgi:hypothetical protein